MAIIICSLVYLLLPWPIWTEPDFRCHLPTSFLLTGHVHLPLLKNRRLPRHISRALYRPYTYCHCGIKSQTIRKTLTKYRSMLALETFILHACSVPSSSLTFGVLFRTLSLRFRFFETRGYLHYVAITSLRSFNTREKSFPTLPHGTRVDGYIPK